MSRQLLHESFIHPAISTHMGGGYEETLNEVIHAIANNPIVIVGMKQNPFCKTVRKNLDLEILSYHYLEYGSYFRGWRRRLVLKMWSGWSTFPMVFVRGQLVGGSQDVDALLASGELRKLLDHAKV